MFTNNKHRRSESTPMARNVLEQEFENKDNPMSDTAERMAREVYVLGSGIAFGTAREIQNRLPECSAKIGGAVLTGTAIGALAATELPLLSIGTAGAAAVLSGKLVWDLLDPTSAHNRERNEALQAATHTAWRTGEQSQLQDSIAKIANTCGSDSIDLLAGIAGGTALKGGAGISALGKIVPEAPFLRALPAAMRIGHDSGSDTVLLPLPGERLAEFVNFVKHGPVNVRPLDDAELLSDTCKTPRQTDVQAIRPTDQTIVKNSEAQDSVKSQDSKVPNPLPVERLSLQTPASKEVPVMRTHTFHWHKDER
jgi:hypothetical protein